MIAIRLVDQGVRVEDIVFGMRLNRSTVFGWVRKYRRGGLAVLKSTKAPGARPKLKQREIMKLVALLLKPAMDFGFESDLWTGPRVRVLIKREFGVKLHPKHMPRFLARLGLVQKTPERRALEQDHKAVVRWKRHLLPRIERSATECHGLILYGDEALFVLIPHIGKTWTFPDIKPIVRVSGKRGVHVGVTSAVSPQGHLLFQFSQGNFNASTLIRFMKSLHGHFEKYRLFFVVDGAPAHRAKTVKQFAADNASWLSLHYLPGYSPELNPDEEVWNFTKTKQLDAKPMHNKSELQSSVLGALRSLQKHPKKIKSFFQKKST